jgi:hypothetical protein
MRRKLIDVIMDKVLREMCAYGAQLVFDGAPRRNMMSAQATRPLCRL